MPRYQVTLDGKTFVLEGDHAPSEDEARAAMSEHTAAAPVAPKAEPSYLEQVKDRFVGGVKRAVHNPTVGAGLAGAVAAPFTGGMSLIPAAATMFGAGAAGAMLTGAGPLTAAKEGALAATGEGVGRGVAGLARGAGKLIYKAALRPSMGLQREFGDVAATGMREGAAVSQGGAGKVLGRLKANGEKVADMLAAKDAERPVVAGYLPPARGIPLGTPPLHPTMPNLRDPRSAGLLMREAPDAAASAGEAAHGSMVSPAEVARRGLDGVHGEMADRALAGDAQSQLGELRDRFLAQRTQPMSLTETQRLKQAEQALSDSAYAAEARGGPVNGVDAQFHKGVARGAREAIEQRVPEAGPVNAHSQELIGLLRAVEDATRRNVPGVGSLRTMLGDFVPSVSSRGGIALDRIGNTRAIPDAFRTALLQALGQQQ